MFVEDLEQRRLLAASIIGTTLTVTGTSGNDAISVTLDVSDPTAPMYVTDINGTQTSFDPNDFDSLLVNGDTSLTDTGNDTITVDSAILLGATINGDGGNDSITGGGGADQISGN